MMSLFRTAYDNKDKQTLCLIKYYTIKPWKRIGRVEIWLHALLITALK